MIINLCLRDLVTNWKQAALLVISLLASSADLAAQAATTTPATPPSVADTVASARAGLARRDAFQSRVVPDRQPLASLETAERSRRPGWLLPVAGAVAGGLIGLTVDNGCARNDCMISIPPPVLGVVYGGALGLIIEIVL